MGSILPTMDTRAYVPKYHKLKPMFIALKGTNMEGSSVGYRRLQEWTCGAKDSTGYGSMDEAKEKKKSLTVCEVLYSQPKAAVLMAEVYTGGTMTGPDMFHVIDEHKKVRINIWQAVKMDKMEIVINDEKENALLTSLVELTDNPVELARNLWNNYCRQHDASVWENGEKYADIVCLLKGGGLRPPFPPLCLLSPFADFAYFPLSPFADFAYFPPLPTFLIFLRVD